MILRWTLWAYKTIFCSLSCQCISWIQLLICILYSYREFQVMKYRRAFIEDLLEARPEDRERCNMLLLFLVVCRYSFWSMIGYNHVYMCIMKLKSLMCYPPFSLYFKMLIFSIIPDHCYSRNKNSTFYLLWCRLHWSLCYQLILSKKHWTQPNSIR